MNICLNTLSRQAVRKLPLAERWKVEKSDGTLMKVVLTPLILFTDDTSGNLSKQYNLFDSYLMTPAAMSYDARSSKNNSYFVCTSNKNLSAVDMLPPLVDDMKKLENGIPMYSIVHRQTVLVVAPLLVIQADNYQSAGLGTRKTSNPKPGKNASISKRAQMTLALETPNLLLPILHNHSRRTIEDLCFLRDTTDVAVVDAIENDGFTVNGSEQLLWLESYCPTLDTPIELLHTLPFGVGKALLQFLFKTTLTAAEGAKLQTALADYRTCQAYSRNYRAHMNHSGSFVGRDFKQLSQIIPVILRNILPDAQQNGTIDLTAKCLESFGCLSSLAYMRNFTGNKDVFLGYITRLGDDLTARVLELDNYCIKAKKTPICVLSLQPKLHMLHQMVQDICRFGLPVHYETEHGEQLNKFIHEEILRTNRHNPSKDVAVPFARQFIIHHIVSGGSYLADYKNPETNRTEIRMVADVSPGIKQFKIDNPKFFSILFDSRENADNNDYQEVSKTNMRIGTSGIFHANTVYGMNSFFGIITTVERENYTIQKYGIETFDIAISSQDIQLTRPFDMHSKFHPTGYAEPRLLNVHKFGSLWSIMNIHSQ
ncbi:hypothetical protein F4703DRAFT_1945569 [Phycomyces blakesleeanus]